MKARLLAPRLLAPRLLVLGIVALIGAASPAAAIDYSPIDCAKATTPADRTICSNYALGQDEARMAAIYGVATGLVAMGQRGDMQDAQRAFIRTREACGTDIGCLSRVYATRIRELNAVIDSIASRGPF
ncbi:lysozyme inhibitor LprI family protein [Rhodoplanes sp. SY1]|uniref:lysozyme inhibitor LprI family protein n=1 Tax=Rhodoplanes sp. SY1 TaxID=3166646 RepID=UPI0038B452DA